MLHNYNVSSIIPERIIKFRLVVMELHGNKFLSKFARSNGFCANEVINVQMNDTIFILSAKQIYIVCLKFHVKTPYGWGARGGNKNKKKITSKNNSLPRQRHAGNPNNPFSTEY
jgi:hypothetical protein